jgi:hypothetical protein
LVSLNQIGAADIHFYGAISGTGAVAKENETAVTRDGGYLNFGKPLVLSEWGVARAANSNDLVNAVMWGGIGIGASGGGLVWTDKYTYGNFTATHLAIMNNLHNFVQSVDWPNFTDNHHANSTEVPNPSRSVSAFACLDTNHAIVLLVASRVGSSTASTVTVNGLTPGTYTADIWQTYAAGKYGTQTVVVGSTGKATIAAPGIATMQAIYIHQ